MPLDGLVGPEALVARIFRRLLEPPPAVDLNSWAVRNVRFGGESPFPGPYDPDRLPFFRRPLECLSPDHPARVVAIRGSAQIGKTVVEEIFLGGTMDLDPCQFMFTHPTEGNAKRWVRTKWWPRVRSSPRLCAIFEGEGKSSKEGGASLLSQERKDGRGVLMVASANSAPTLAGASARRQVQDDLSLWDDLPEGDPEGLADDRSKAFARAKVLKVSTPNLVDECRISAAFARGTQEYFHVPCPHCGHRHPLEFEPFRQMAQNDPAAAVFVCPQCGGVIEERHRAQIVASGEWIAHNPNPEPGWVSFHIWAAYAGLESWRELAQAIYAAKGDPAKEKRIWNTTGGEPYEQPGDAPAWDALKARADAAGRPRGVVPRGALLLTLTLDCQDEYVDGLVCGWGRDLKRWVIDRVRVEGHISEPETRAELNEMVDRVWPSAAGQDRRVDLVGIDGNAWTDAVFDWVKEFSRNRVVMVRGVGADNAPSLAYVRKERRRDGKLVKYQGRFFNVGVSTIKAELYKFLRVSDPGQRGFVDIPAGLEDDFYEQLTAEKRSPVTNRRGFTVWQWNKPRSVRNEQLDCFDERTEVLTQHGWRRFSEVSARDYLATVNLESDLIEMQEPSALIAREHHGEMIHLSGRRLDIMVTPKHRMVTYKKEQIKTATGRQWNFDVPPKITLAEDLTIHHQLKMAAKWEGFMRADGFTIAASHKSSDGMEIEPARIVDPGDWAEFLGWYTAEGSRFSGISATQGNRRWRTVITQNGGDKLDRIRSLVARLPWKFHEDECRDPQVQLVCASKQLFEALSDTGGTQESRRVPSWVKIAPPEIIRRFVDAAIAGDGWTQGRVRKFRTYATISSRLANDMQELFIKLGAASNIAVRESGTCHILGRESQTQPLFLVSECRGPKASLDGGGDGKREFIGRRVTYSGMVYCATVPNGTLICRRNGRSFIAGNCMAYGQALAGKLGWRTMTAAGWVALETQREVAGAAAEYSSTAVRRREVPAAAAALPPASPQSLTASLGL